ncbi:adenylyl-sulfate kinase [Neobacillus thermocopriae]|uniref:adenylyl-sulfate kinase n=1 Tax=Neobacillus thermocopriae TaxID=1215031 RepID=UPI002E1CB30D|nr:adenylyl-sulfate kinase [Neobacillus thermocopriae]MED3624115.1 adenylyl-sulfate kinase [Neobacillus thermocopriae]MED3713690.1 adenylyl-sulfate kinase [Neobacillus thermocopriae]
MGKSKNITWHETTITKADRRIQNGHGSCVLWFTGLSGSGKSTIANAVSYELYRLGINEYVLDGDNIRHGLNKDLGFSEQDRAENIRRIGEVAKLFVDSGKVVTTAFISPFRSDRDQVRAIFEEGEFIEVYIDCPLEECERRDPKQLYAKARRGEIKDFTGIDSPYEAPENPEIVIHSDKVTVEEAVEQVLHYLREKNII